MKISWPRSMSNKISLIAISLMFTAENLFAAGTGTLGDSANLIRASFSPLSKLITGGCYVGGLAFMVGAIMKFKQHKDNPTQVTIGTPIALLLVGAGLLFMPSVMGMAGMTIFQGGTTAGPSGAIFS